MKKQEKTVFDERREQFEKMLPTMRTMERSLNRLKTLVNELRLRKGLPALHKDWKRTPLSSVETPEYESRDRFRNVVAKVVFKEEQRKWQATIRRPNKVLWEGEPRLYYDIALIDLYEKLTEPIPL